MAPETVSPSVQDYAKAVYALEDREGGAVSTNDLAERLGVSPGSASGMVRKLAEQGLLEHQPYHGVRLTEDGRRVALKVIRRHRLIELFLSETLDMPWDRVHAEAEVLEHALSERLERLIAARLGHPEVDPHGDPIPSADFEIDQRATCGLDELPVGTRGRFVRVSDSDPAKLRYLAEHRIRLGDRLEIIDRQPFGGPLFVRFGELEQPIGGELARAMRVEVEPAERGGPREQRAGGEPLPGLRRPAQPAAGEREPGEPAGHEPLPYTPPRMEPVAVAQPA